MTESLLLRDVNEIYLNQINPLIKKIGKGGIVHAQGDLATSLDVVISGHLVAYTLASNGSENSVFDFQKNSIIGANLLFGNANRYPMNIYCTADCELLQIGKSDVEILLHDYTFTRNFIKNISLNSQGMNQKIAMYTQKTLRENVLDYLKALAIEQKNQSVILPINKKQLADYFGVQRPSLFRELKRMREEGLIEIVNRKIIVKGLEF